LLHPVRLVTNHNAEMPLERGRRTWRDAATLLLALVALKAIALAIDPTIRLYLGDSAAYLAGALSNTSLPSDRSFIYSLLIRALVRPTASLWTLLFWQTLAGIGTAWLLWVTLVRHLAVPRALAGIAACGLAIEPAHLYYERMVMAETFGLLALAAFFAVSGAYLRSARVAWLPAVATLGLAAASLRLNYLPIALVVSLALPFVRALDVAPGHSASAKPGTRWRPLLVHSLVAVCSVTVGHTAYRHAIGAIFEVPPTYLARGGFMQLGLVAPLLKPEHFAQVGLPADFGRRLAYDLRDPDKRTAQTWEPGGLAAAIAAQNLDVEPVARALSRMAIADDPLGLVRLGLHTVGDYFRPDMIRSALDNDLGRRDYPKALLQSLREDWGYDATGLAYRVTPVSRYFEWGSWWLVACLWLTAPLAVMNVIVNWRAPQRSQLVLSALLGLGLVAVHVLFVNIALYRYLHPLPFFVIANALPLAVTISRCRFRSLDESDSRAPAAPLTSPLLRSSPHVPHSGETLVE
jgi:hypothetical protein